MIGKILNQVGVDYEINNSKALKSYLRGHIEKHIANVNVHLEIQ